MSKTALNESKYKRYSEYKDSGVEWLEEVPCHWIAKQLKFMCTFNDEVLTETVGGDYEIEYIDIGSVSASAGVMKTEKMLFAKAPSRARRVVRNGDVIISTVRTYLEAIAPIDNPPDNLIVSTGFAVIRPNNQLYKGFAAYCLRANGFIREVIAESVGVSYPAINATDLVSIKIPALPYTEQIQIANFLDHETAKIDTLIDKQQQLIKLLKEKRQAVISHAVTCGLSPDAPMKDSGVEWIGRIPEHWYVAEVRRFTEEHRQGYYSEKGYDQTGHRVVRITDILNNNVIDVSDSPFFVMDVENRNRYELKKGDFLFQRTGSHKKIGVFNSHEPSVYASFLIRFRFCGNLNHNYILNFFNSTSYKNQLNEQIHGGVNPNIHAENIKICKFAIPPENEQVAISDYIQEKSKTFDEVILKAESAIELMQERRTALISAAVTGKIDVCDWQTPISNKEAAMEASA